jgi:Gpi18-like mannosyltransferase
MNATLKHTELHTFIYAQRKVRPHLLVYRSVGHDDLWATSKQNIWHYLGQQRWKVVWIKSIWAALADPVLPFYLSLEPQRDNAVYCTLFLGPARTGSPPLPEY